MGTTSNFSALCSNLYVDNQAIISDRYKRITRRLNLDFWGMDSEIAHSRYVGSYGRDTAIRGFHDLDILFQLPSSFYEQYDAYATNGQSALLQAVKNSIGITYPLTTRVGDGQVVVVTFADGMRFEVVPAFLNTSGSYTFPDSNNGGKWRITNPLPEITAVQTNNNLWNKNLKRLCRMARAWRREWDVPMGGLLIDTLASQFMGSWTYRDKSFAFYDWMMRDFLYFVSQQNPSQVYWRAVGSGQEVRRTGSFEYKALKSYNIVLEAIDYDSKEMPYSAAGKWREIYGSFYPSATA